jgi:hypothetical protein
MTVIPCGADAGGLLGFVKGRGAWSEFAGPLAGGGPVFAGGCGVGGESDVEKKPTVRFCES